MMNAYRNSSPWKTNCLSLCVQCDVALVSIICPALAYNIILENINSNSTYVSFAESCTGGYIPCIGFTIRTKLREKYNLRGSVARDALVHCCCHCVAMAHVWNELARQERSMPQHTNNQYMIQPNNMPMNVMYQSPIINQIANLPLNTYDNPIRNNNNNNNNIKNIIDEKNEISYENTHSIDFSDFPRPSSQKNDSVSDVAPPSMSYIETWDDVYASNIDVTKLKPGDINERRLIIMNSKSFVNMHLKRQSNVNNEKKPEYSTIEECKTNSSNLIKYEYEEMVKGESGKLNKGNSNLKNSQIINDESSMGDTLTSKRRRNSIDNNLSDGNK